MATLSPLSNMTRQPFGSLNGARLRNLSNVKNTQNAILPTPSSTLKRSYEPPTFDDVDSENIDPSTFSSPTKKNKSGTNDFIQPFTASNFTLTNVPPTDTLKMSLNRPIRPLRRHTPQVSNLQKRKAEAISTPPTDTTPPPKARRIDSAPAVAGRSPKGKRIGILSRRRMTSSPFTRINPPSFISADTQSGLPFSIDAALSATVPSYNVKAAQHVEVRTLDETIPQGWMFNIHEDSKGEEVDIIIGHSASALDISDDESRAAAKNDRGKENIPPSDGTITATPAIAISAPTSRKNMMTEEPRTPLGDLDASEFYAEGCDASSYIHIPIEESSVQETDKPTSLSEPAEDYSSLQLSVDDAVESNGRKDVLAQVQAAKDCISRAEAIASRPLSKNNSPDTASSIEIWESESAKGDDDGDALDNLDLSASAAPEPTL